MKRISPEFITQLADNEIFVFGSNLAGMHGGGAARVALMRFGAIMGQGVGLQGQSYAIPTMHGGVDVIKPYVDEFIDFAVQHPELKFLVTAIGCGIAGYQVEEIAPLFERAGWLENVYLPVSFWKIIMHLNLSAENIKESANGIYNLCRYMHRSNAPTWNSKTDEAIFNSLDRCHMWALGVKLGVISPTEDEPQTKALPEELRERILSALKAL